MPNEFVLQNEVIKAALAGSVAIVTLALGWIVGVRITATWTLRQKRRELELSAATELYRLYGEFFAVWKLWNYFKEGVASPKEAGTRWELLKRAALIDAGFEALLVKVSSERVLDSDFVDNAGHLRQGFQQLRRAIKYDKGLDWRSSQDPEYLKFKETACAFANFLATDHQWKRPMPSASATTLKTITSNDYESLWYAIAAKPKQADA